MKLRTFWLLMAAYLFTATTPLWALDSDVQAYLKEKLASVLDVRLFVSPPTEKTVVQLGYPATGNIIIGDTQFVCAHDGEFCGCINLPQSLEDISVDELLTLVDSEPLTPEEEAACEMLAPKWRVAQSRYGPTRPLYDVETEKSIGRAPVGSECGELVRDSYRGKQYRMVSLGAEPKSLPDGLVALYDFDEGEGDRIHDTSGVSVPLDLFVDVPENIQWVDNGLEITASATLASAMPAAKITTGIKASKELTIEAWVKPANVTENKGPARIATVSLDPGIRNFTLGQQLTNYGVRYRTSDTNNNGTPSLDTPADAIDLDMDYVVYTMDDTGHSTLYLDGIVQGEKDLTGNIDVWEDTYKFALANELTGDRPWLGTLYRVAIYDRALTEEEVLAEMDNNPLVEPEPTLVGYSLCEKVTN